MPDHGGCCKLFMVPSPMSQPFSNPWITAVKTQTRNLIFKGKVAFYTIFYICPFLLKVLLLLLFYFIGQQIEKKIIPVIGNRKLKKCKMNINKVDFYT